MSEVLHAGLLALRLNGRWRGALVQGASGAGKSDLALRALAHGFVLVADDRVVAWADGDVLYGRAPDPLAGLMEARGVGVVSRTHLAFCRIDLIVQDAPAETVERLPDPVCGTVCGVPVPLLRLALLQASTPAKLVVALRHLPPAP